MLRRRHVELVLEHRIARRVLVDVGGTVADPLARDEDRQFHVQLQLAHLERRGVPHAHQVVDQPAIVADLLGAAPVRHARRLHDRGVIAHVVDHPHEPAIEHRERLIQDLLERRHHGAQGRDGLRAQRGDLAFLLGTEGHRPPRCVARRILPRGAFPVDGALHRTQLPAGRRPPLCRRKTLRAIGSPRPNPE